MPESLERIEDGAFRGCTSLGEVEYAGTIADWENIEKVQCWDCDRHISWNEGCPAKSVKCTDGEVSI